MSANPRIDWLDTAKGLSIIGVVLFHAHLCAWSLGFEPAYTGAINDFLQPIRMPLFFTISGVLAANALARSWPTVLAGRVWTYVYIFGLWGLLRWIFFGQVVVNVRAPVEGTDWTQLLTMWVLPTSALWFVWALAIYFVVAKLADRFRTLALLAALLLACFTWGGLLPLPGNTRNLCTYLCFFLFGAWYGRVLLDNIPKRPVLIGAIAAAGFLAIEFVALPGVGRGLIGGVARALESIVGLAMGCAVAVLLSRLPRVRNVLAHIGRHTLPVYVTHVFFISGFAALLTGFAGSELWRYIIVPLLAAVSIPASLLLEAAGNRLGFPWLYRAPPLRPSPQPVTL